MAYYPKSQVTTNLHTNGNELCYVSNNVEYIGYYYTTSKGRYFTGKTPSDSLDLELKILNPTLPTSPSNSQPNVLALDEYNFEKNVTRYVELKKINPNSVNYLPTYFPTLPTQQDYVNGEMRRYFCKKTNEIIYLEISKDTYDKLVGQDSQILWQLYQPFNLPWQLTGSKEQVFTTNKNIVELASVRQKLPMLMEYLKMDFTKYYK
jgi:hypothetical protein